MGPNEAEEAAAAMAAEIAALRRRCAGAEAEAAAAGEQRDRMQAWVAEAERCLHGLRAEVRPAGCAARARTCVHVRHMENPGYGPEAAARPRRGCGAAAGRA